MREGHEVGCRPSQMSQCQVDEEGRGGVAGTDITAGRGGASGESEPGMLKVEGSSPDMSMLCTQLCQYRLSHQYAYTYMLPFSPSDFALSLLRHVRRGVFVCCFISLKLCCAFLLFFLHCVQVGLLFFQRNLAFPQVHFSLGGFSL